MSEGKMYAQAADISTATPRITTLLEQVSSLPKFRQPLQILCFT